MREADQRAEVGLWIGRIPQADALNAFEDFGFELGLQRCGDKYSSPVGAHLAGAVEVGHHGDIGGAIQAGVVKNNQRGFATQLHGDFFQRRT